MAYTQHKKHKTAAARSMERAKTSRFYNSSEESELEWALPKTEHTFDEDFNERPGFVKCLNCLAVIRYSQSRFGSWSMEHGEMCRKRE